MENIPYDRKPFVQFVKAIAVPHKLDSLKKQIHVKEEEEKNYAQLATSQSRYT